MQKTKDTFLNYLATGLTSLDDTRTVIINGVIRPAVIANENERPEVANAIENCFCIDWEETGSGTDVRGPQTLACAISYWTSGSAAMSGVDRGRALTALDELLRLMLAGNSTPKLDLTATPAVAMGSDVFWGEPKFAAPEKSGMKLQRKTRVDVHYFVEAS